eukprot:TRINITY_DN12161_c1_g4_i4.p1 TRINITY_DN12161_c1_g4~~TRINITY_DN12161_c1_g4_i4.p1  ORF type:complete len:388 (+),score=44.60 TRINITY_DN12161_c1_g4_i4:70-1233(+)
MEGLRHQSKEGSRGGSGNFNWEDIKTEKYADYEQYLGHSVMAPIGRWQKNQDITWFNKNKKGEAMTASQRAAAERLRIEKEMIKQQEADLQAEALGLGPAAKRVLGTSAVTKQDLAEVLGTTKREGEPAPSSFDTADRIKGVGFKGDALISRSAKQERAMGLRTFDGPGAASGGMKIQRQLDRRLSGHSQTESPEKTSDMIQQAPRGVAMTSANLAPLGTRPGVAVSKKSKKDKKDRKDKKKKKKSKKHKHRHRERHDSDDNDDDDDDDHRRPSRRDNDASRPQHRHRSRSPRRSLSPPRRSRRSPSPARRRSPAPPHNRSPHRRRRSPPSPRRRSPPAARRRSRSPPRRSRSPPRRATRSPPSTRHGERSTSPDPRRRRHDGSDED